MSSILIEARGLTKAYGRRTVVDGIDLSVLANEVLGVIGPNGAGKSTTLELLLGLRKPDRGSVAYWTNEPHRQIGVQLQACPFFPGYTALENMRMFAAFYRTRTEDALLLDLLARCGLDGAAHTDAAKLSGGQQKRLAIAVTLIHRPKLIFLDEPTAALDPKGRRDVRALIRSLAAAGTAVVLTSHEMDEVHKLADRIVMIVGGRIAAEGTPAMLLHRHEVEGLDELYLRLAADDAAEPLT